LIELKTRLQRDIADLRADQAEAAAGDKAPARVESLQKEIESLDKKITSNEARSAEQRSLAEPAESELRASRSVRDNALARLNDLRASAGARGERLRIIDPGIVPQQPSSPNITVNILAAIFIAAVASLVGVTFSFVFQRKIHPAPVRAAYR
jgi:uncharacterized protein involved in exopolysaccharide biosynthesis